MSRLPKITLDQATPQQTELFDAVESKLGRVPNLMLTLGNSPAALRGYLELSSALGAGQGLDAKQREVVALAVAEANGWDNDGVLDPQLKAYAYTDGHWVGAPFNTHRHNWIWINKGLLDKYGGAIVRAVDALAAITGNVGIPGGQASYYFARKRGQKRLATGRSARTIAEPLLGEGILAASRARSEGWKGYPLSNRRRQAPMPRAQLSSASWQASSTWPG